VHALSILVAFGLREDPILSCGSLTKSGRKLAINSGSHLLDRFHPPIPTALAQWPAGADPAPFAKRAHQGSEGVCV